MTTNRHTHDWSEVDSWSFERLSRHHYEGHNPQNLSLLEIRGRYDSPTRLRNDHDWMHLARNDGTSRRMAD